ncbi:hypothetical protein QUF61_10925, partial [Candidatus Venteria ishoeyi]|uniref:hypothetical protein n=1 Tax=Candidatus Venteria ishoeyi TaxID=1899563 RepID=UPI0025A67355
MIFLLLNLSACLGGGGGSGNPDIDNSTIQGAQLALVPEEASGNGTVSLTALLKDNNNAPLVDSLVFFSFADQNQESLNPGSA